MFGRHLALIVYFARSIGDMPTLPSDLQPPLKCSEWIHIIAAVSIQSENWRVFVKGQVSTAFV